MWRQLHVRTARKSHLKVRLLPVPLSARHTAAHQQIKVIKSKEEGILSLLLDRITS